MSCMSARRNVGGGLRENESARTGACGALRSTAPQAAANAAPSPPTMKQLTQDSTAAEHNQSATTTYANGQASTEETTQQPQK